MRRLGVIVAVVIVLGAGALFLQQRARMKRIQHAKSEAALRDYLAQMRAAIAKYRADHGQYPQSLDDLIPQYIRRIPPDPMTNALSWRVTTEETVQPSEDFSASSAPKTTSVVVDVHSSAPGYTDY